MVQTAQTTGKVLRGFAAMTPERRREISSKGGKSVPAEKRGFSRDPNLAREAGKKAGQMRKPMTQGM